MAALFTAKEVRALIGAQREVCRPRSADREEVLATGDVLSSSLVAQLDPRTRNLPPRPPESPSSSPRCSTDPDNQGWRPWPVKWLAAGWIIPILYAFPASALVWLAVLDDALPLE